MDKTAQQLSKKNCRMTGFTDCSTEMFHVDYMEPGQPKKSKSILLRVIQRIVQFEKGSVNILMEKDEKSCEVELSSMSTQSCEKRGERRAYYRAV